MISHKLTTKISNTRFAVALMLLVSLAGCGGGTVWRSDTPGQQQSQQPDGSTGASSDDSKITSSPIVDGGSQTQFDPNSPASLAPDVYLLRAEQSSSPQRESLLLDAVSAMLDRDLTDEATAQLAAIDANSLPPALTQRHNIAMARIEAERIGPESAMQKLRAIRSRPDVTPAVAAEAMLALSNVQFVAAMPIEAAATLLERARILELDPDTTATDLDRNSHSIWRYLDGQDVVSLRRARSTSGDPTASAWYELAEIHRLYAGNSLRKDQEVGNWRRTNPQHPANSVLGYEGYYGDGTVDIGSSAYVAPSNRAPAQIALLLPMNSQFSKEAQAVHDGFISMHEQDRSASRASVVLYDIGGDPSLAASFYQQAISDGADFVVGPLGRSATEALISSNNIQVPTLLLGASESLTGLSGSVYQFGLLPEAEARLVAERAFADGHRSALILTPSSERGARLKVALSEAWTFNGGTVLDEINYTPGESREYATIVKRVLKIIDSEDRRTRMKQMLGHDVQFQARRRQDVDVILLAANARDGRLLKPQINFYQGHDLPVYATSRIYSARPNALSDADLDGIVFPEMPWIVSQEASIIDLRLRLTRSAASANTSTARLFAFGMDAYGLIPALDKLRANPRARFGGVTALLGVDSQNSVTRSPIWTRFSNGMAEPVDIDRQSSNDQSSDEKLPAPSVSNN